MRGKRAAVAVLLSLVLAFGACGQRALSDDRVAKATVWGRAWPPKETSTESHRTTVTLHREERLIAETETDAQGKYLFRDLGPGHYRVTVTSASRNTKTTTSSQQTREFDLSPGEEHVEDFA